MKRWVDADACPVVAREILFRAADTQCDCPQHQSARTLNTAVLRA